MKDLFKENIKNYLDDFAKKDSNFATAYSNENKTIDKCVNFIIETVKESQRNGFADDEIYYLARHYYLDIDENKKFEDIDCKIVINQHIELTQEEKDKAKEEAIENYKNQIIQKEKEKNIKIIENKKKKDNDTGQLTLF